MSDGLQRTDEVAMETSLLLGALRQPHPQHQPRRSGRACLCLSTGELLPLLMSVERCLPDTLSAWQAVCLTHCLSDTLSV